MIRPATRDDVPMLHPLWELGRHEFDGAPSVLRDGTFADLVARIPKGQVLLAEHGDKIAGMVSFELHGGRYVGTCVAVWPEFQRRGIGRALIESAHEVAKAHGAKTAMAVRWLRHEHLQPFYESAGYLPVAQLLFKELR